MFKIIMTAIVIFNLSNFIVTNVQAKDSLKGLSKSDFLDAYEEKA